jgi:DNA-binding CsgD family transcriptional regulator
MKPRLDWAFAQQCDRAEDVGDLRDLLQIEFERLGFRYFLCCSHVPPDRPPKGAIYLVNYPRPWLVRYQAARHFLRDPVFLIGRDLPYPFRWDDAKFRNMLEPDQLAIMEEAAAHGLKHGVTIPLHGPDRHSASCSLVADGPEFDADTVMLAQRYALYAYEAARALVGPAEGRPHICLPRRERQCMELIASGKDDEAIAIILGIERETVRRYVQTAKERLGVSKRPHAVAKAIYAQAINLEDIFRRLSAALAE